MIPTYGEFYQKNYNSECYYLNKRFHREGGPAVIYYNANGQIEAEFYYFNGFLHRLDGPAYIIYYTNKIEKYYIDGEEIKDIFTYLVLANSYNGGDQIDIKK